MRLYHFTELSVDDVHADEVLGTVAGRTSLYWQTVFSPAAYQLALDAQRAEHGAVDDGLLRRAAGCSYVHRVLTELLFESVRVSTDGALPSRSTCLFLSPTRARPVGLDVAGRSLLEIEPLSMSGLFRACPALLDGTFVPHDIVARAQAYWSGSREEDDEVLYQGPFRITRVVRKRAAGITLEGKAFSALHRP